jgi:hypothetical protein
MDKDQKPNDYEINVTLHKFWYAMDCFENEMFYRKLKLCGISSVVWRSEFLATDPEVRVRFPALPDFPRSSGSGTGSTQPRDYN